LVRLEIQSRYGAFYPCAGLGRYVCLVVDNPRNGLGSHTCQRCNVTDGRQTPKEALDAAAKRIQAK